MHLQDALQKIKEILDTEVVARDREKPFGGVIMHEDGRHVTVPYRVLHKIEAGHPVGQQQELLEIMVDA